MFVEIITLLMLYNIRPLSDASYR